MKFKGGEKYSGEWKEGLFHGSGSLSYDTGLKYQGEFERGSKHGSGILELPKEEKDG
jgi:hypothetical protein